jgi:hypothetical protein
MESKYYRIRRGRGGNAEFHCSHCNYHVRISGFDPRNGNVRTQAATAMNEHHLSEHKSVTVTWAIRSVPRKDTSEIVAENRD